MSATISDDVLQAAGLSEAELYVELAVFLYSSERLSLGKAASLARKGTAEFLRLLGSRGVALNYGVEDLEQDLRTIRERGCSGTGESEP